MGIVDKFRKPTLVLDFDGTLTDLEKEAQGYPERFEELFLQRFNETVDQRSRLLPGELHQRISQQLQTIRGDPEIGCAVGGQLVGPATMDPYALTYVACDRILAEEGWETAARTKLLLRLYDELTRNRPVVFRRDAARFLQAAKRKYRVRIVTNSDASIVREKLQMIDAQGIKVHGGARKHINDPESIRWGVAPDMHLDGMRRPVLLRRQHYNSLLHRMCTYFPNTTFVGDTYEFDLALPEYFGARVVLISKPGTTQAEKQHMARGPKRHLVDSLQQAADVLGVDFASP